MDTSWLEDFLTLAECANFSRAAEQRHMTQPAFSRRIRALEEWVGTALFSRDTHQIALTPAGDCFRPAADEMLRRLRFAREEALETAGDTALTLRFAATHALSLTFFPAWLRTLESAGIAGPISLVANHMQACEALMLRGGAHFLLCHHHPRAATPLEDKGFVSHPLGMDRLVPVSAPDDGGDPRHRLPGTPEAPLPFLTYSPASGMGRILTAAHTAAHLADATFGHLRPVFTSHAASVLKTLALSGRGIAWAPLCLAADDLAAGRLVRAGDARWDVEIEIRLIRPRARQSRSAEAFWTHLQAQSEGVGAPSSPA
ncbi:LysR family transcriptional regulator [Methylorubrum populi]